MSTISVRRDGAIAFVPETAQAELRLAGNGRPCASGKPEFLVIPFHPISRPFAEF